MRILRFALFATALFLPAGLATSADHHSPRQYYGAWYKHPTATYYYRSYYYKPSYQYAGYKHHFCIYYPTRPTYVYYYNPYKRVYWGRCPSQHDGKPVYSLLAEADRKGDLEQIPEKAFPEPAALPVIPEATDNAKIDLPPDDLPSDAQPIPLK